LHAGHNHELHRVFQEAVLEPTRSRLDAPQDALKSND